MAEAVVIASSGSQLDERRTTRVPQVRLKLRKPRKKVAWTTETVDNEHMNKKKSKCCCIYEKPRQFGESSSEEEDECDHCRGHVERRRRPSDKEECGTEDDSMMCEDGNTNGSRPT